MIKITITASEVEGDAFWDFEINFKNEIIDGTLKEYAFSKVLEETLKSVCDIDNLPEDQKQKVFDQFISYILEAINKYHPGSIGKDRLN